MRWRLNASTSWETSICNRRLTGRLSQSHNQRYQAESDQEEP